MPRYRELEQVLEVMAKTGDKVIVVSENHAPYVLMSISEYESFLKGSSPVKDLTEDQLLDRINRDIAVWKASQDHLEDYDIDEFKVDSIRKNPENKASQEDIHPLLANESVDKNTASEDDKYYIEPVE